MKQCRHQNPNRESVTLHRRSPLSPLVQVRTFAIPIFACHFDHGMMAARNMWGTILDTLDQLLGEYTFRNHDTYYPQSCSCEPIISDFVFALGKVAGAVIMG